MHKFKKMTDIYKALYKSPIGIIEITANEHEIISLYFTDTEAETQHRHNPIIDLCVFELDAYFEGKIRRFTFPFSLNGTDFQKKVWSELLNIAYSETISYAELSKRINNPKAIRAVGTANGKNPLSIVVPCHRVIGSNGKLVGYSGGLWRKKWLLDHEKSFYTK